MKHLYNIYRKLYTEHATSLAVTIIKIKKQTIIELIEDLYRKAPSPDNPLLNIWYNQPDGYVFKVKETSLSSVVEIIKNNIEFHDVVVNLGALRLFKLIEQQNELLNDEALKVYFDHIRLSYKLTVTIMKNTLHGSKQENTVLVKDVETHYDLFEGLRKAFKIITDFGPLGWKHEVTLSWRFANERSEITLKKDDIVEIIRHFNDGFQSVSDMLLDETSATTLTRLNQEAKELLSNLSILNTTASEVFDVKKTSSLSLSWIDTEQKDVLRETILLNREPKYEYLYMANVLNTFIDIIGQMPLNKLVGGSLEVRRYDAFNNDKLNVDEELGRETAYELNVVWVYTNLIAIRCFINDAKLNHDCFSTIMEE